MSDTEQLYQPPVYDAPRIIQTVGTFLRGPRGRYSTNFADVFSSDGHVQYAYINGLLAVMISFLVVFIFWVFVLLVLKFKGREVGCASGRPFLSMREDEAIDGLPSTDESESYCSVDAFSHQNTGSADGSSVGERQSNKSRDTSTRSPDEHFDKDDDASFDSNPADILTVNDKSLLNVNQRERRTRLCFIFFSLVTLVCVPIIFVYSVGPLNDATQASDEIILVARATLGQVRDAVDVIESATDSATAIVEAATLDIDQICPNIDADGIEDAVGVDLKDLVDGVSEEYNAMIATSNEELELVGDLITNFESGLTSFEESVAETEDWLWVLPAVLFAVSFLTVLSMLGVLLAWKGKAGRRIQNNMSYFVLPFLMATTVACWIIVMATSLGSMLGSDVCTAGSSGGAPDDTIQQILDVRNLNSNGTTFTAINAYTNQCIGPSPTSDIDNLQKAVQDNIDSIWRQISKIDSIGRSRIMERCGGNELENLLATARNLAKLLTIIRRSLDNTSSSLSCPKINLIYVRAAHDAVCTDFASAAAYGFVMFLILGISLMIMLSLRASWLQNIEKDKVYHDESDVAENMILDEHEEYLAYISKYKHEWQEYGGFNEGSMARSDIEGDDESFFDRSEHSSYFEEERSRTDAEGYNGSDEGSDSGSDSGSDITPPELEVDIYPFADKDPEHMKSPESSGALSLANLDEQNSHTSLSIQEEDFFKVPSPLLPTSGNRGSREDPPEEIATMPQRENQTERSSSRVSSISKRDEQISTFFERYGIDPGTSARRKDPTQSQPVGAVDAPTDDDPPAARVASVRNSTGADATRRKSLEAHELTRTTSLRSRGALPSGRTFFRASSTGNFEVEVQLSNNISGSPFLPAGAMDDDLVEC